MAFVPVRSSGRADQRSFRLRPFSPAVACCATLLLMAASGLSAQVAQALRVVPLVRADKVQISIELRDGFTPDVRAAIHSGLETTFTYTVDLRLDVAGWIDRTMGQSVITNTVDYTTLTRKYQLERRIDGRLDRTDVSDDEGEVRQWLTSMRDLPIFPISLLERNREYYVRVSASARPSHGSMLWPFGSGTSGQAKFTFIR
jgi:hypothetical protein